MPSWGDWWEAFRTSILKRPPKPQPATSHEDTTPSQRPDWEPPPG